MKSRSEIKDLAKERFRSKYWLAVGLCALAMAIGGICSVPAYFLPVWGSLASIFVGTIVTIGLASVFLKAWAMQDYSIGNLFHPFTQYWRNRLPML